MSDTNWNFITNYLDFYGKTINLHIFKKDKYKTKIGAVFGIISILIVFGLTYFFIVDLINRNLMTVILNQDETSTPVIDLTNMPILFTISDVTGNIIRPERLFNFDIKKYEVYLNKTEEGTRLKPRIIYTSIPVERCQKEKHIPEEYEKYFKEIKLDDYYCANTNNINLTLYGKYGDFINGFSLFHIYLNKCQNSTSHYNNCYEDKTIDKLLTNVYFNFAFLSNQINHYNSTHSRQFKLETLSNEIPSGLLKGYRYFFNQVIYDTDYGLILQDNRRENYYKYETYEFDIDTRNAGISTSLSNFFTISLRCSSNVHLYNRSYLKLQTFLANIGGILNSTVLISEIILTIITRRFYLIDLLNSIFFLKFDNEITDNSEIKKVKKLNFSNLNLGSLSNLNLPIPSFQNLQNFNNDAEFRNKQFILTCKNKPSENILYDDSNNIHNNSNSPEQFNESHIYKHTKMKLSFKELIFPKFCFKNKNRQNIIKLENCENFIKKRISLEYILEKFYDLDAIFNKVFNNDEIKEFNINKRKIINYKHNKFDKNISKLNSSEVNNKENFINNFKTNHINTNVIEIKNIKNLVNE